MSAGRIAASALAARVAAGSDAAAAARNVSKRRPRRLSTAGAAVSTNTEGCSHATAVNRIDGGGGGTAGGRSCSRSTGNGHLEALLALALARLCSQDRAVWGAVVSPHRALPWASRSCRVDCVDWDDVAEVEKLSRRSSCAGTVSVTAAAVGAPATTPVASADRHPLRRSTSGGNGRGKAKSGGRVSCGPRTGRGIVGGKDRRQSAGGGYGTGLRDEVTSKEKAAFEGSLWLQKRLGLSEQQSTKVVLAAPLSFQCEGGGSADSYRSATAAAAAAATATAIPVDADLLEARLSWLSRRLHLNKSDIRKVVRGYPRIFAANVESDLEPRLAWLGARLGLNPAAIRKLVVSFPTVFSKSVKDGLETKLTWLETRLGMTRGELSKMVVKYPTLLSYSVEDNLEPRIRWLEERLGLDDVAVRKMVLQFPAVFGYSIDDNLEPKMSWLQSNLALDLESSQRLVRLAPPILGASIDDNLRHKLSRLEEILGMSREDVVAVLIRKPAILALDADNNIEPKVRFFIDKMGARRCDVRQALEANSSLLMYSLDTRWRPRLAHMRSLNVQPVFLNHWRPMATRDDRSFGLWLEDQTV